MKKFSHERLNLSLGEVDEKSDLDICVNVKSPDRSHNWKASRLQRSKTYSGSPSPKIYDFENIGNDAVESNDGTVAPLSPVNQRKWGKTNMKRRSSNARLHKTTNDKRTQDTFCKSSVGATCETMSTMKIEVRRATDISDKALLHRYCCPCKQYFDDFTNVIYKLQQHEDIFDSNKIDYCDLKEDLENIDDKFQLHAFDQSTEDFANKIQEILVAAQPENHLIEKIENEIHNNKVHDCTVEEVSSHEMLHCTDVSHFLETGISQTCGKVVEKIPQILDNDSELIRPTPCDTVFKPTQTMAESTQMEDIIKSNQNKNIDIDFESIDDSIVELKNLRNDLTSLHLPCDSNIDFTTIISPRVCCEKFVAAWGRVHPYILESMSDSEGSVVYILIAIFSYLDIQSLYNAGSVCRTWHCASQHPAVWSNVHVKRKRLSKAAFHNLSISCVSTQSLTFQGCIMDASSADSCEKEMKEMFCVMSNSLTTLNLINTEYSALLLKHAIVHSSNLKHLKVSGDVDTTPVLDSNCPNLTCINLLDNKLGLNPEALLSCKQLKKLKCISLNTEAFQPEDFKLLFSAAPNLQHLHITHGPSLHSKDITPPLTSVTWLLLTDTYISPRAVLFVLFGAQKLKVFEILFTADFAARLGKLEQYMENIKTIQENTLFKNILSFSIQVPPKPRRQLQS